MSTKRRVARFNRLFANHLFGPLLRRLPGFGTVHHRGRKSGKPYRTPVKVFRRGTDSPTVRIDGMTMAGA